MRAPLVWVQIKVPDYWNNSHPKGGRRLPMTMGYFVATLGRIILGYLAFQMVFSGAIMASKQIPNQGPHTGGPYF